jgi:Ice-binding-like
MLQMTEGFGRMQTLRKRSPMITAIITGTIRRITSSFRLAAVAVLAVATACLIGAAGSAGAATATAAVPVPLGTAANFAVLGAATVTNTGATTIKGDLGLSPGTSVTGFPPGQVTGTVYTADSVALKAQADLTTAYNDAAALAATATIPVELGGTTETPGVYASPAGTFGITGTLTLNAQGNPAAVFVFKAASTLITASASNVKLINGAKAANVFWLVGSSATLGTYSTLRGNIMALASITVTTGVTIHGRALARTAAVTLDTDTITK